MSNFQAEQIETRSKKVRGMAQKSLDLIEAMYAAPEAAQPITGRGVGCKLFTAGLIPSMARPGMQRVYRLLKEARERGDIPWHWIVDETREFERCSVWDDPKEFAATVSRAYRRDFWTQQPVRGAKKEPCAECCTRFLMNMQLASASCMGSAARTRSTMSPRTMMAAT
jgi:hypothetical protein